MSRKKKKRSAAKQPPPKPMQVRVIKKSDPAQKPQPVAKPSGKPSPKKLPAQALPPQEPPSPASEAERLPFPPLAEPASVGTTELFQDEAERFRYFSMAVARAIQESSSSVPVGLEPVDLAILMFLQEDIPLLPRPYAILAQQLGLREEEVLQRMEELKSKGFIRRVGALLNQQKAGYAVNVLTAWGVNPGVGESREEALERMGQLLAGCPWVSHCYLRSVPEGWEWPLFAMLHAVSSEQMAGYISWLKEKLHCTDVRLLPTVREWKKTSMKYF